MNDLIIFAYESGVCMAVLFSIYWIFLRRETYFQFNRFYLLGTVVLSVLIPLGNFNLFVPNYQASAISIITTIGEAVKIPEKTVSESTTIEFSLFDHWHYFLIGIYLFGAIILLSRVIFGIIKIEWLKRNGRKIKHDGYSVVYLKQHIAPFSFFKTIFINKTLTDDSERSSIIDHELQHIKQLHTWDNILIEIFLAVFWFNPFMWLIKRALRNTHEYLADDGITGKVTSVAKYQSLLLKQIHGLSALIVTNNFNSMIKNRIKMMCKRESSIIAKFKPLLIVPTVLCLTLIFAFTYSENNAVVENLTVQQQDTLKPIFDSTTLDNQVFFIVEDMPSFQGTGQEGFRNWITENLVYPENAKRDSISGRVYIQFTVDSVGQVSNVAVVRGVHPALDKEAIRVVEACPDWIPGKQRGQNVAVQFTFPIDFTLD